MKKCSHKLTTRRMLIVVLLFPFYTIGQNTYTGTVSDKSNLTPIPYATVALQKENTGINADEQGNFSLLSRNTKQNDTLIISSAGYETFKMALSELPESMKFELLPKQILPNVSVSSKRLWKNIVLNDYGNCGTDYLSVQAYTAQYGQYIYSDTIGYLLSEVEICKYSIAIIDPDKSIFRLRFYAVDSLTGAPSYDITDSVIEIKSTERRVTVHLDKYKIYVPGHDFFVAIEWLKIPYNASREKSKINGQKYYYTDYGPLICHKRNEHANTTGYSGISQVWQQDYKGKWTPSKSIQKLMISVKIKY